jgi:HEAT repeat protein
MRKCCTTFPRASLGILLACALVILAWQTLKGARGPGITVADIRQLAKQGPDAVPALVRILETRDTALDGVGRMICPYLSPRLNWNPNQRTWNRCAAAQALGEFGTAARSALPALHRALDNPSQDVAVSARIAIGQINGGP